MKKLIIFVMVLLVSQSVWAAGFWGDVEQSVKSTPELAKSRQKILVILHQLQKNGVYSQGGVDEKKRSVFVGLQSAVEQVLSLRKKENREFKLVMAIHTPQPATPLCTVDNGTGRPKIVRDLLKAGSKMYVVFEKDGLKKRTPEQQKIYKAELKNHKKFLQSRELKIAKINPEMIGATYLFEDEKGQPTIFFIQATQANSPSDTVWQIGLGPVQNPQIKNRLEAVLNYLADAGQPGVKSAFEKSLNPNLLSKK